MKRRLWLIFSFALLVQLPFVHGEMLTYHSQIEPIIKANCVACHRESGIAPFTLEKFSDVYDWAKDISRVLSMDRMPLGASARLDCSPPGTFYGPHRLSDADKILINKWIENGRLEGTIGSEETRKPETFSQPELGEPDLVLPLSPNGFVVPGSVGGLNIIRNFPIDLSFEEDHFIMAAAVFPDGGDQGEKAGLRRIVHHAHLFYDEHRVTDRLIERFRKLNPSDDQPGWTGDGDMPKVALAPWFPGMGPTIYPEGVGHRLKAHSRLVLQVHYAAYNEIDFIDHTKLALWFARYPIQRERKFRILKNEDFTVPANNPGFKITAGGQFDSEVEILSLVPHMHQLGKRFTVLAKRPNRPVQCMLDVDWDFDHQNQYVYRKPLALPAGTRVLLRATYDNSLANPRQFNFPPKNCAWGESDITEMMLTMVSYVDPKQILQVSSPLIEEVFFKPLQKKIFVRAKGLQKEGFVEIDGHLQMAKQEGPDVFVASLPKSFSFRDKRSLSVSVVNADSGRSDLATVPVTYVMRNSYLYP